MSLLICALSKVDDSFGHTASVGEKRVVVY